MSDRDVDLAHLPRGQLALREFVSKTSQVADTTERDFFEVKSSVDLTTKPGRAKLAKFILGAANRDPATAARRFDGHALLILGIKHGELYGIPPFEAHEVQAEVQRFTGIPGPAWDFDYLPTDEGRSVIVVMVMPPEPNKQPWVCQAENPQEKMRDGDIFLRADGQTRTAKGVEVHAMLARQRVAAVPNVDLEVLVAGTARSYCYDERVVEEYIEDARAKLLAALPKLPTPVNPSKNTTANLSPAFQALINNAESAALGWGTTKPENRTQKQYRAEIDAWADEVRAAIPELLDGALGYAWKGCAIRVQSNAGYLAQPEFDLHIAGEVEAVDKEDRPPDILRDLPRRPRSWGPRSSLPDYLGSMRAGITMPNIAPLGLPRYGRVNYTNGGSVSLQLDLDDLRPGRWYTSDDDEFVLLYRGDSPPNELYGTWTATVKGHDRAYSGEFTLEVDQNVADLTDWLAGQLARSEKEET